MTSSVRSEYFSWVFYTSTIVVTLHGHIRRRRRRRGGMRRRRTKFVSRAEWKRAAAAGSKKIRMKKVNTKFFPRRRRRQCARRRARFSHDTRPRYMGRRSRSRFRRRKYYCDVHTCSRIIFPSSCSLVKKTEDK